MSLKLAMKTIPVQEAVGTVLCHDITRIEIGAGKGPVFRKGHRVTAEDIPVLLSVGKENLYVYQPTPGLVHENDAASRIAAVVAGQNLGQSEIVEGKINFQATCHGLLQVDVERLCAVNSIDEISLASLHTMQEVQKGQNVAGTRVIPLMIDEARIRQVEELVTSPVIDVLPLAAWSVGIVTTGSEVYKGRIKDGFGPVLRKKFAALGCAVLDQILTDDSVEMTASAIGDLIARGAQMVVCTGGMSVDPDDRTPAAIQAAGGEIVCYGAPMFPGAMFLLAWNGKVPILGLPGCVMYHKASIFDIVVPRLLAGVPVSRNDIARLGHGGFCSGCQECHYPHCAFGKY